MHVFQRIKKQLNQNIYQFHTRNIETNCNLLKKNYTNYRSQTFFPCSSSRCSYKTCKRYFFPNDYFQGGFHMCFGGAVFNWKMLLTVFILAWIP